MLDVGDPRITVSLIGHLASLDSELSGQFTKPDAVIGPLESGSMTQRADLARPHNCCIDSSRRLAVSLGLEGGEQMVHNDIQYVQSLISAGLIRSPCLEAGAGLEEHSVKHLLAQHGIEWFGTDLRGSSNEVYAVDLCDEFDKVDAACGGRRFETVLVLNIIEHVFEPIKLLDNAIRLLKPGGHCVVVVPTVWPLHYYPLDCWRVTPNFFEEYAARRRIKLLTPFLRYVTPENRPVDRDVEGNAKLPMPSTRTFQYWKSRVVHKVFGTYGRGMSTASHVSTGAVLQA